MSATLRRRVYVRRGLYLIAAAAWWAGCGGSNGGSPPPPTSTVTAVPTALSPTAVPTSAFPTPTPGAGVSASITNAVIASTGQISVTFSLTDASGIPIQPVLTSGQPDSQARVRLTLAHLEDYSGGGELAQPTTFSKYVNEINMTHPAYDSGGTIATVDPVAGVYQYTFKTQLAAGFDTTRTYTVGMQVDRNFNGQQLSANPVFDFVPAGGTPEVREGVVTQACNHCHDPLIAHGNRREVRLCLLCHTADATDSPPPPAQPDSIEFRHMIHRLHRGKDLPSVVNGPNGGFYGIYSSFSKSYTIFSQKDQNGKITGVGFPRTLEDCTVCHDSSAPTASNYLQKPSTAPCTGCHDDVNPSLQPDFAGPAGTNHFQNQGYAEGDCISCHKSTTTQEFNITVPGAHVIPERSSQLQGLKVTITGVTNAAPGQAPTIAFTVTNNAGISLSADDVNALNRLGFAIAGSTTDYTVVQTPTAVGGGKSGTLAGPDASGTFTYTPASPLPADAAGTWTVGAEARRMVQLTTVDPIPAKTVEEATVNSTFDFSVDGSPVAARRLVVDVNNCANCHGQFSKDFSIHGSLRNQTTYCVLCHNPNNSDVSQRKAAGVFGPVTPIDFKVMIHKIHRGADLENKPYLIYGFGGSVNDFSNLLFPGDLRDCAKCHAKGTYLIPPFPGSAVGTQVAHLDQSSGNLVVDGRLGAIRSVCTACHDGDDAVAHAETMTATDGTEACPVCHQEGADFAVSMLHAGRN